MLENMLSYERDLFFLINGTRSEMLDYVMWIFSSTAIWAPLVVVFLFAFVYRKGWKEWLPILLAVALVILLCDQFTSTLCKPLFARFRPTHHPMFMEQVQILFGYTGGRYGFMSSHAANTFGFAAFTALLFRYKPYTIIVLLWAAVTGYSRIYLGVHFISDVVCGAIAGLIIGVFVYKLYMVITQKLFYTNKDTLKESFSIQRKYIAASIVGYIFILTIFNETAIQIIR
jgi:undecaprenyl-diphosphatase